MWINTGLQERRLFQFLFAAPLSQHAFSPFGSSCSSDHRWHVVWGLLILKDPASSHHGCVAQWPFSSHNPVGKPSLWEELLAATVDSHTRRSAALHMNRDRWMNVWGMRYKVCWFMLWSATGDLNQQDGEMLRVSVINNSSSGSSTGEPSGGLLPSCEFFLFVL